MNLRVLAIVALALSSMTVNAQDYAQRVTFSTTATTVKKALTEIAKLTKTPLGVSVGVQGEIVLIDVKDVPLRDLLDRIATVTSSSWKQETSGVLRLVRPAGVAKAEIRTEAAERAQAIARAIAKSTQKSDAPTVQSGGSPLSLGIGGLGQGAPVGKAGFTMLSLVDPAVLANIEEGNRLVFSTNPTAMQLRIGSAWFGIVQLMMVEQAFWADTVEMQFKGSMSPDAAKAILSLFGADRIKGSPAKALLSVERRCGDEAYDLRAPRRSPEAIPCRSLPRR
jgi:hypothetical protein